MKIVLNGIVPPVYLGSSRVLVKDIPVESRDYDVARFAIPDYQVTDAATFEVDVVVGMVDPTIAFAAPDLSVNESTISTTKTWLIYPGTSTQSTFVYRASVPLSIGANVVTLRQNDSTSHSITITRKASLTTQTVLNDTELVAALEGLYAGEGLNTDIIECGYDVTDIVTATSGISADWSGTSRSTFCTVRPASGFSIGWDRGTTPNTGGQWSPGLTLIKLEGIDIGSATSNEATNTLVAAPGSVHWIHGCSIDAKYSFASYGYGDDPNAETQPTEEYAILMNEGGDKTHTAYFTGNTIRRCWSPFGRFAISRDNTWIEHRHDVNRFGIVSLNQRIQSIKPIARIGGGDFTHCDLLQTWGNNTTKASAPHENLYFAGFTVEDTDSHFQGFLIDATFDGECSLYKNVVVRDFDLSSREAAGVFWGTSAQMENVLFAGINFENGYLTHRFDVGCANYTNVFWDDSSFLDVRFNYIGSADDQTYNASNVSDRLNVAPELNAELVGSETYPTYSQITTGPSRFGPHNSGAELRWRTGNGVFDASVPVEGLTELQVYDAGSISSVFFVFNSEANKNAFVSNSPAMSFVVTNVDSSSATFGTVYTYAIAEGNVITWSTTSARVQSSDMTGSSWPPDDTNLWGDYPRYSLTIA